MREVAEQIVSGDGDGAVGAWNLGGWCVPQKARELYDRLLDAAGSFRCHLDCVEIGVYQGKSLFVQAYALSQTTHGGHIVGIDPYTVEANVEGFDLTDPQQVRHVEWWERQSNLQAAEQRCRDEIDRRRLSPWCSLVTAKATDIPARPCHWLHLDDSHSPMASLANAQHWVPSVMPGGIVVVDDVSWPTMRPAVQWIRERLQFVSDSDASGQQWAFYRVPQ